MVRIGDLGIPRNSPVLTSSMVSNNESTASDPNRAEAYTVRNPDMNAIVISWSSSKTDHPKY